MTKVGSHGKLAQPAISVVNGEHQEQDCGHPDSWPALPSFQYLRTFVTVIVLMLSCYLD